MAIKTFNIDESVYKQLSAYCKKNGVSMSRMVENFLRNEVSRLKLKLNSSDKKLVSEKNNHFSQETNHHSFSKYC